MASSYATFSMFLCVAMAALTAPSAANLTYTVNLNGALVCAGTGTPAAPNVTASLACVSDIRGVLVVIDAKTSAAGTISASTTVGPRTSTTLAADRCGLFVPPQACPGTGNVTIASTVTVTRSRNTFTVTPSSQVRDVVKLPVSS